MNLLLSNRFPASHTSAGQPTNFERSILIGQNGGSNGKIHTIRENYAWWEQKAIKINAGDMVLSLKQWTERPYHSEQRKILELKKIGVQHISMEYDRETGKLICLIDGKPYENTGQLAANDGLSLPDFIDWFFGDGKTSFSGVIIHFTDFRY